MISFNDDASIGISTMAHIMTTTTMAQAAAAAAAPAVPAPAAVPPLRWVNVVWSVVRENPTVEFFEHPLLGGMVCKSEYEKEFGPVLRELQGQSMADFVDFFFERDQLQPSYLRFHGSPEREDFYDWAVDLGCCPSLREVRL